MSWPPVHIEVSITVQYCNHFHNLVLNQKYWSGGRQWNNTLLAIDKTLIIILILEGRYEIIETGSPALESTLLLQLVLKIKSGVVNALTSNLPYELKNTVGREVKGIRGLLDLAFSIETVKDVLNLDLLPGVQVHKVQLPPSSGIGVSLSQFFMSKLNVISLVPIVLIEQGKIPVTIIDVSSSSIAAKIDLSLDRDSTSWLQSEPTLTLCILTMPLL